MQIKYRLELDDLIDFNQIHMSNSVNVKNQKIFTLIVVPVFFLILTVPVFALFRNQTFLIFSLFLSTMYVLIVRRSYTNGPERVLRRIYTQESQPGLFCEHIMEIDEEGVSDSTDLNARRDLWLGILKIVEDEDFAFIYVGPIQAYIVPRHGIVEGNFDAFVKQLQDYWNRVHNDSKPKIESSKSVTFNPID